jgi:Esterase PHB depolymerase
MRASTACLLALGACRLAGPARGEEAPAATGLRSDVAFSEYSSLSSNAELVRRLLSPLAAAEIQATLAESRQRLIEQSIDLSGERFLLYVPARAPAHGYGLLVFIPPWQEARLPTGWAAILDRYGMIFVSAARSGNEANVLARREPLALLAAVNVMHRYAVDAEHVYVGGFSGGARIALRLALGYPDVFRGALLDAGSDPLGNPAAGGPPLPARELFERFEESTRVVYVTGELDTSHLAMDANSLQSLRRWCIFNVESHTIARTAHEIATPAALDAALHALLAPLDSDPAKLSACRAGIEKDLTAQLERVEALTAAGKRDEARKLLTRIDLRFGGLAAPRSLELLARLQ